MVVQLWTDGASSGPQEKGGWAVVMVHEGVKMAISGYEAHTTSNRMELTAVVKGLEAIGDQRAIVTIFTDSSYVKKAHTHGWIRNWKKNGWISSRGDPVANKDLWEEMIALINKHLVKWQKVRGHSIHELNNIADAMAVRAKHSGVGETVWL